MGKLTKAQKEAMSAPIFQHFDVWGGYWWTHSEDGSGRRFRRETIDALVYDHALIVPGQPERVASGRQRVSYSTAALKSGAPDA